MPLENFGSILNFAARFECLDRDFYKSAAGNPGCAAHREVFSRFSEDEKKNEQTVLRMRRENVTEMILESIRDFTRAPFEANRGHAETDSAEAVLAAARILEERAEQFYSQAAEKLKALPEVSRGLKLLAKKRKAHRETLETC